MRKRGPRGWEGRTWDVPDSQNIWNDAGKAGREMEFRTEYQFSTELPFKWASFTTSVRDHNLREASRLFYEGHGKE